MREVVSGNSLLSHNNSTYLPTHGCNTCGFVRRCLASPNLPHQHQRNRRSRCVTVQAAEIKPAYNKYRSRYDIDQDYINQWKEVTARDRIPTKMTPLSFLWFVPLYIKYHVIPGPVRYLWWVTWCAFLRARYQIRKRLVLLGAKLDVELMKRSKTAGPLSFSRAMVLRRLHGHVDPLQNFQYRMHLLQGVSENVEEQAVAVPA
ncbi:hypothetical protein ABBQ32_002518 [Trebouxia sp. C0010 RCD-2024]